jgi:hypothetical protein
MFIYMACSCSFSNRLYLYQSIGWQRLHCVARARRRGLWKVAACAGYSTFITSTDTDFSQWTHSRGNRRCCLKAFCYSRLTSSPRNLLYAHEDRNLRKKMVQMQQSCRMYPRKHNWKTAQRTIYSVDLGEVVHARQEHGRLGDLRERPPSATRLWPRSRSDSERGCARARALLKEEPAASRTAPRLSITCSAWPSTSSAAKSFVCAHTGSKLLRLPTVFTGETAPRGAVLWATSPQRKEVHSSGLVAEGGSL